MNLKCEFPEGCRLDLWAMVVKAKFDEEILVMDDTLCILESEVGGRITNIEDVRIKVLDTGYRFNFNNLSIRIDYKVVMVVLVDDEEQVVTFHGTFKQDIDYCQFDPPLTSAEIRAEIDQAEIIINHWIPDWEILGDCVNRREPGCFSPVHGTLIRFRLLLSLLVKIGKMHDVIVYGEMDPES